MQTPSTVPASPQETAAATTAHWGRRGLLGRLVRLPKATPVIEIERDRDYARAA